MRSKILITALVFSLALPAMADRRVIEEAYEVAASDLRLPRNAGGTIALRECDACDYRVLRVAPGASFIVNDRALELDKFRALLAQLDDADGYAVIVVHHVERDQVISVSVTL